MDGDADPAIIAKYREIAWYCLDQGHVGSATFAAERLLEMNNKTDADDRHLVGICHLRAGRIQPAFNVTVKAKQHVGCAYIAASAAYQLGRCKVGINILEAIAKIWRNTDCMRKF